MCTSLLYYEINISSEIIYEIKGQCAIKKMGSKIIYKILQNILFTIAFLDV